MVFGRDIDEQNHVYPAFPYILTGELRLAGTSIWRYYIIFLRVTALISGIRTLGRERSERTWEGPAAAVGRHPSRHAPVGDFLLAPVYGHPQLAPVLVVFLDNRSVGRLIVSRCRKPIRIQIFVAPHNGITFSIKSGRDDNPCRLRYVKDCESFFDTVFWAFPSIHDELGAGFVIEMNGM